MALLSGLEKSHDFFKKIRFFYLNQIFFYFFYNLYFHAKVFTKFLKLVCLLNHINNTAAMLLLFSVILLLSKK